MGGLDKGQWWKEGQGIIIMIIIAADIYQAFTMCTVLWALQFIAHFTLTTFL